MNVHIMMVFKHSRLYQKLLPCNFLRWNLGLPKKLFLILVNLVFHSWPPAVALHADAVIAGDGAFKCGDPGGVMTDKGTKLNK